MARNYRFFLKNPEAVRLVINAGSKPKEEKAFQEKTFIHLSEKLEPEIVFQLVKVLRAKSGDLVTLIPNGENNTQNVAEGEGSGENLSVPEYVFEVLNANKHTVEMAFHKIIKNTNELKFELNLWLCVPNKPDKLEFILEKAVEIGVKNIFLFESDFSQMKHQLRMDRLEKILMEAAEQSERAMIPVLEMKGVLGKFLEGAGAEEFDHLWVAMERLGKETGANPFQQAAPAESVSVLVGPEGGFSEAEKTLITGRNIKKFSLGKRVLRMETAAILSLGLAALLDS